MRKRGLDQRAQYPRELSRFRLHHDADDRGIVCIRYDALMARVPMNQMGVSEEIAEAVVWMCSDRASFMNGASHMIDGGYYAA
ncbi:MAG: short chain dehydrogenase [Rhodopila sp.]|jgi:NAD(P)-dependent dehydrogenase (short-subunit alcohol dehydrogenase family)|nr:short chain dehydrogenase [Rhodopila sp.]